MVFAVISSDAWPRTCVVDVTGVPLFVLRLLAPLLAGAVNVTDAPDTGLLNWSRTVTTSGLAKAVFTVALCGEPDATTMLAAAIGRAACREKAGVPTPRAAAVTE